MRKIKLFQDVPMNLDLNSIVQNLNNVCKYLKFDVGNSICEIKTPVLMSLESYETLSDSIKEETEHSFRSLIFSEKQYYNNYFFESYLNTIIVSFNGWDSLTRLSMHTGVVFFIADILSLEVDNTYRHDDTTGCIYDFRWYKPGIDLAMRNASICRTCQKRLSKMKLKNDGVEIYTDLRLILDELRKASKDNEDIVSYWEAGIKKDYSKMTEIEKSRFFSKKYDVFLAHNSKDKADVEKICNELRKRGLKPWLDIEQVPPGRIFQDYIEEAIKNISAAAIIIGNHGLGKWQYLELKSFISQCIDRNIPVIPVLLPRVYSLPENLIFLREFSWVSFIGDINETKPYDDLEWGITGMHPNH
jgi:nucleotide-binding universal stress UspA family protein